MNDKRNTGHETRASAIDAATMGDAAAVDRALHEELSAFMDGELDPERARFLQQRLAHDANLRARWERWQLLSSSMRRQAQPLPAGFAARVAHALDVEAPAHPATHGRAVRWGGGVALAASLVVAGVFMFDAMHVPQRAVQGQAARQVAGTAATIMPIRRTVLQLPDPVVIEPVITLPIPLESGVVTAYRSPLHPVLLHEQPQRAVFAPFPQPYPIDPELEAYLQRQKTGATRDVFSLDAANRANNADGVVRTVAWPQDDQR